MTEDEAKTKWCPHKRVAIIKHDWSEITTGHNQIELDGDPGLTKDAMHYRCIGSACMAWRTSGWTRAEDRTMILLGYCGLAGRP
jgi:hypothetical protein